MRHPPQDRFALPKACLFFARERLILEKSEPACFDAQDTDVLALAPRNLS
jgi:hypothetical protein